MPAKFWRKRQIAMKEQYSSDYEEGHADGWDAAMESFPQKQREWVGLTDEEIEDIHCTPPRDRPRGKFPFARMIEAKLREKNSL